MAAEVVKTSREIVGREPKVGYEWDGGNTPPHIRPGGRWTVRLTEQGWETIFHPFPLGVGKAQGDKVLATFGGGEEAEREAKRFALALVEEAWRS